MSDFTPVPVLAQEADLFKDAAARVQAALLALDQHPIPAGSPGHDAFAARQALLTDQQQQLSGCAFALGNLDAQATIDAVSSNLAQIQAATEKTRGAIKTIADINNALELIAAVVGVATAVAATIADPAAAGGIVTAGETLAAAVKPYAGSSADATPAFRSSTAGAHMADPPIDPAIARSYENMSDNRLFDLLGTVSHAPATAYIADRALSAEDVVMPGNIRELGMRIFARWSSTLHDFLCSPTKDDKELADKVWGAITSGGSAVAVIAGVLVSAFSLAPATAAIVAALVTKLILAPAGAATCEFWNEELKRDAS